MSSEQLLQKTDIKLSVKQTFGFDSEMKVGAFSKKNEYVPKVDPDYKFDKDTTLAILSGTVFMFSFIFYKTFLIVYKPMLLSLIFLRISYSQSFYQGEIV